MDGRTDGRMDGGRLLCGSVARSVGGGEEGGF